MNTYSISYWIKVADTERSDHAIVEADNITQAFAKVEDKLKSEGIEYTSIGCCYEIEK